MALSSPTDSTEIALSYSLRTMAASFRQFTLLFLHGARCSRIMFQGLVVSGPDRNPGQIIVFILRKLWNLFQKVRCLGFVLAFIFVEFIIHS